MEVPAEALPVMENMGTFPRFSLCFYFSFTIVFCIPFLLLPLSFYLPGLFFALLFFSFCCFLIPRGSFLIFHPCTALGYVCVRDKRDVREREHYISQDTLGCMHPKLLSNSFFCLLSTGIVATVPAAPVALFFLLCVLESLSAFCIFILCFLAPISISPFQYLSPSPF